MAPMIHQGSLTHLILGKGGSSELWMMGEGVAGLRFYRLEVRAKQLARVTTEDLRVRRAQPRSG
jgi:hypothetical protein